MRERVSFNKENAMKPFTISGFIVAINIALFFSAAPGFSAILHVGPQQPYKSLQSAVDIASFGDTIFVTDSIAESTYVANKSLNIFGEGGGTQAKIVGVILAKNSILVLRNLQVIGKLDANPYSCDSIPLPDSSCAEMDTKKAGTPILTFCSHIDIVKSVIYGGRHRYCFSLIPYIVCYPINNCWIAGYTPLYVYGYGGDGIYANYSTLKIDSSAILKGAGLRDSCRYTGSPPGPGNPGTGIFLESSSLDTHAVVISSITDIGAHSCIGNPSGCPAIPPRFCSITSTAYSYKGYNQPCPAQYIPISVTLGNSFGYKFPICNPGGMADVFVVSDTANPSWINVIRPDSVYGSPVEAGVDTLAFRLAEDTVASDTRYLVVTVQPVVGISARGRDPDSRTPIFLTLSKAGVLFNVYLDKSDGYSVKIIDNSGRTMWEYRDMSASQGRHQVQWNCGAGKAISSGNYFAVLSTGRQQYYKKILIMR